MGLDAVELVMDVEERFETSIPDDAAEKIQTVGELTCIPDDTDPKSSVRHLSLCGFLLSDS